MGQLSIFKYWRSSFQDLRVFRDFLTLALEVEIPVYDAQVLPALLLT